MTLFEDGKSAEAISRDWERVKAARANGEITEEQFIQLQQNAYASIARYNAAQSKDWYKFAAVVLIILAFISQGFIAFWGPLAFILLLAYGAYDYFTAESEVEKAVDQGKFYNYLPKELKVAIAHDIPEFVPPKEMARLRKEGWFDNKGYQPPTEPAKAANLHPDARQPDTNKPMNPADRARLAVAGDRIHGVVDDYQAQQQQLGQSVGQRLADIPRNFAQGVAASIPVQQQTRITFDDGSEYAWTDELLAHNAIALWGSQGGGKTSKAAWILTKRIEQGAFVAVLDPFAAAGKWEGLTVFGRGLNFSEVEKALVRFTNEAKRRIKERAFNKDYSPFNDTHWHFMLDEMTDWEKEVNPVIMGDFINVCAKSLRQCNMSATCCTHGKTMTCFGGQEATKGKADVLKRQFLWIQVLPTTDLSVPGNLRCSGEAIVSYEDGDQRVKVPEWMQAPPDFDYRAYNPIQAETTTIAQQVNQQPTATAPIQQPLQPQQQPQADIESYRPDWWGDKSRRLFQWQTSNTLAKSGLSKSNIIKKMQDFKSEQYRGFAAALAELEEEFGKLSNQ